MKRKITGKTMNSDLIVKLSTETDVRGNIFHMITCENGVYENEVYFFSKLSSAIDFINSNFE